MEQRIQKLEAELAHLKKEFAITLGRANGLNLSLLTLARDWGKPAAEVIADLQKAIEAVVATGLQTPLADATLTEQTRVARQILQVLEHAALEEKSR